MTKNQIDVIERLRSAAIAHGEVADLLDVLGKCLFLDGLGNKEINASESEREYLEAAILAASFVEYDRAKQGGSD